ncbi:MAG TPA: AAA family ATPase, partial [Thermomicrobiaceae bacterium]|nr:AAA family ATPase [Thermomicrobiaceae bacterium]
MERPRDGAGAQIELRQPPLVGRQRELARLRAALAQARAGDGRAVFLAGEAGAGKTRLAQTAAKAARVDGFQVLDGRAYSLEGGLAYAPILGAFGPLLRRLPPGRRERLTDGLPDLGRLFSHLRLPPPPSLGNPALEKTRLFDAIARLLERLAAEQPLLVLLDDLHWADPASIELLHYLSRDLGSLPVLLLGSYRPEEIDAARGLRALLTSLRRVGLAEELALARLPPHEIAALARGVLGGEPPPELLELLNTQAGGTPLYAEAMIGALADAGLLTRSDGRWTLDRPPELVLPTVVRDLLLERLSRLGEAERGLLDLLAAGGEAVRHPVLRAVSRLDEETLLARLGHLRALGLVAEEALGDEVVYTTGHPLIQHVAYGDLAEIARRRAHAAYAAALERLHPAELDRLAHHYRLAGPEVERGRALEVLLAAGRLADEQYANDQAARHYGAALALARQDSIAGPELLTLLLERLGRAWERVGEGAAAVAIWREAIEGYEQAGERVAAARLYRLTALAEWDRGQFDAALADFEAGLRALGEDGPAPELAELLHAQLIVLNRLGEYERSLALARRLRALAAELGSARVLAGAYLAEAHPLMSRWRVAEALAATERGLAAAEQAGEPLLLQRGHDQMSLLLYDLGEHQRSRRHAEQSLAIGRRLRAPMLAIFPRNRLVSLDLMAGDWERARRESAAVLALAHRLEAGRAIAGALGFRSLTCLLSGDLDEARAGIARARAAFAHGGRLDRNIFSPLVLVEMLAALEEGDAEGALAALARLEGQPATGGVQFRTEAVAGEVFVAA